MRQRATRLGGWATAMVACVAVASAKAETFPAAPPKPAPRVPQTDMGIEQLPNDKLDWFLDAKFGMFIHWGLYAGPGVGEWMMENKGMRPAEYRKFAFPESGDSYFDAKDYDPAKWAQIAKDAGMKWMCLTTRHHDGFCLFDSPHPNAFTSMQTLHRDLVGEYVKACREAGLKVGLYYSPLSWRYPGYYDVNGTGIRKDNTFGYKTDPSDKQNARLMKEENYVNVHTLMTKYGKIDHIYWDGGWLAQKGTDADGAYFNEPGKYLDPNNAWPIPEKYQVKEDGTGRAYGIMGMVRHFQPDVITNPRYGWIGDIKEQEGGHEIKGPMLTESIFDKNMSIQPGPWGYSRALNERGQIIQPKDLIRQLADCTVRNMTLLLNVAPDRHGVIPPPQVKSLREVGAWLNKMGDAVYGTRGGPWEPKDRQFGYSYKHKTVFAHLLREYQGDSHTVPPLGKLKPQKAYDVWTGKALDYKVDAYNSVTIDGIDRKNSPVDTIVGVVYDADVATVWD